MSYKRSIKSFVCNQKLHEFIRFCIVGIIATIIHYVLYLGLMYVLHVENIIITNVIYAVCYVISWFCNLYLTAHFTFHEDVTIKRGVGFALSHGLNFLLHMLFLNILLGIGMSSRIAPIPVFCIVVPINFILVRFVFKRLN